ncbi:hypothetical protein [Paenibacillus sp. sgz5001063]|uniref:hypothetical protein n=1 Tax=Paenibacillus sp. sgz5001063 TaxID=3242474 RepID=UPI0036D3E6A5
MVYKLPLTANLPAIAATFLCVNVFILMWKKNNIPLVIIAVFFMIVVIVFLIGINTTKVIITDKKITLKDFIHKQEIEMNELRGITKKGSYIFLEKYSGKEIRFAGGLKDVNELLYIVNERISEMKHQE